MKSYWYVSLTHKYPQSNRSADPIRVVMSVQVKKSTSVVEMIREATPKEIDLCKFIYCGYGSWKDRHIPENVEKYIS